MNQDAPISVGQILTGSLFNESYAGRDRSGQWPGELGGRSVVGTQSERFRKVTLTGTDLDRLTVLDAEHSFDGDGRLLRLGLQAWLTFHQYAAELETIEKTPSADLVRTKVSARHKEFVDAALRHFASIVENPPSSL